MRRRFAGVQILQLALLLSSIAAGFLVVSPLRDAADRRAEVLKNQFLGQIEESLGISIEYESISPALLSIVTVRGLNVSFDSGDFSAETVRVFYNPLRRLEGHENDPVKLISRIAVSNSSLNIELDTTGEQDSKKNETAFDPWPLLADKSVVINNFSVHVLLDESKEFSAENVSLQMNDERGTVRYTLNGMLYASGGGGMKNLGRIETSVNSRGIYSPRSSTANGRLDLADAESDLIKLEPLSIDFTYSGKELTARRIDDSRPLDLEFRIFEKGWSLDGEAVGLSLREIAAPGSAVVSWDPWFSSNLDGRFAVSSPAPGELNYDVNLDLSLQAGKLPWDIDAEIKVEGNSDFAQIDQLRLSSDWGELSYKGSFETKKIEPNGKFAFHIGEKILGYPVSAVFNLTTENGAISAEPVLFDAAGLEFDDFRFLIIREPDIYALSMLVIPGREGDDIRRRLTVDGLFETGAHPVFHGFTDIEGLEASYITRLLGFDGLESIPFIENSLFNMQGYFEADSNSWVMSVSDAVLQDREEPENNVSFNGRASPGSVSIDSLRVSWNDYVVDGRGFGNTSPEGGIAEARILIGEESYPLHARWFPDGEIRIDSNFGFNAFIGQRSVNGRSLQVFSHDLSIPVKNGRLVTDFDIRGRVARTDWDLYVNKIEFSLTDRKELSDIKVSFNGTVNPGHIVLPDIRVFDDLGDLSGNAFFESTGKGNRLNGRFFLGSEGDESYEIALNRRGDIWDVGVDIISARMERFNRERFKGQLSVEGRMTGTLENPLLSLNVKTADGRLDNHPLEAHGTLSLESGGIRIQDLYYEYDGVSLSRGLVLLNLNSGTLRSTAELNATFNQVPVSTGFSLAMDFGSSLSLMSLATLTESDLKGTLATRAVLWDSKQHLPPFTFQFKKDNDSFRVQTPDGEVLNLEYVFETGDLSVVSAEPLPVAVRGGGTIKDGILDLSFPELSLDPVLINYSMFRDPILLQYHVVFQSGIFTGNLDIKGPVSNPDINGLILAENLLVDTPYTYAQIQPASTKIHFRDHRIDVDTLEIPIGDGILYAGGHITLDRLKLVDFDMVYGGRGTVRGPGVPVYYPLMGVNLDGVFTGEVHMTGGNKHFLLKGDVTFPYLKASLGSAIIPVSQLQQGAYPATVELDFNFITGNNCTFYLPNEQLKIVKATAESGQVINLRFFNRPRSMTIKGRLPIKSGDIYYFDRDFQITDGAILFNETLGNFDPLLTLRAETKVRDDNGEDVSVALVYNSPIKSDFTPSIETIPARSDLEVMALFGQAVAPYSESKDTGAATTVLLATGGMFGQVGIVQPFEEILREGLNLDMVTIRTDIIENALAEGLARGGTADTDSRSTGLGRYLDNTSLYAGKYIGDALFISGTVSANYFEGQRLRSVFGGLEFETSVSLEMETPFFNVAWSYSPDPTRNLGFVADNEISLKWQFSY